MQKSGREIRFDIKIPTKAGCIFAVWIERGTKHQLAVGELELANVASRRSDGLPRPISYDLMHQKLGHMGKAPTLQIAKYLNYAIQDAPQKPCEHCAVAKARQKNVPKTNQRPSPAANGELMYLDLCAIKQRINGPKVNALSHWRMMVDGRTGLKFSAFYTSKSGMVQTTLEQEAPGFQFKQ